MLGCAARADSLAVGGIERENMKRILIKIGSKKLSTQVAISEGERGMGLAFRKRLGVNSGMLFVLDEPGHPAFHMIQTSIPLDIAFIGNDGSIINIYTLEPFVEYSVSLAPHFPLASYAFEVNRGWFRRACVKNGDVIDLKDIA